MVKRILRDLEDFPTELRGCALSIGKFDGVHSGHLSILERLRVSARTRGTTAVVFTFDPSPGEIIRPHLAAPLLCTTARKIELITQSGLDTLLLFPTTKKFLSLTSEEFFQQVILEKIGASVLVEGENFTFGANRTGNIDLLKTLCSNHDIRLQIVPSVRFLDREVSSSRIRSLIREGQMEAARGILSRPYRINGYVVHGEHRGRRLGFPTANLAGVQTLLPKRGLYAAYVQVEGCPRSFSAAVHVGENPTFGVELFKIEIHLLDFTGDLYGKTLQVDFLSRIRDVVRYESQDHLLAQIQKDLGNVQRIILLNERT